MSSTAVGIFDVTGTAHQIGLIQTAWGRLTTDVTPWMAGRIHVVFTANMPLFRYSPTDVHEVRGYSDRSLRRIRIRHGCKNPAAPNLGPAETQYVVIHELFHFIDYDHLVAADRGSVMALFGITDYAGHVMRRWRNDSKGYWWLPEENAADNCVRAFTDITFPDKYKRPLVGANRTALHDIYATATGGDGGDGGDPPGGGAGDPPDDGQPTGSGYSYKPALRSQFDYTGHYGDLYPDERMLTINGHPARYWEGKNCTFAAGAMAMDRHTSGGQRPTPNQLRKQTSERSAAGASLHDIKVAWANASSIASGWSDQTFTVADPDTWDHFLTQVKSGCGAIVQGHLPSIQGKYRCQPGPGYRGAHAIFVNEWRSDGYFLVYDPLCRPSDNIGAYVDKGSLDAAFTSITSEAQPRWVPVDQVKSYAESWFGLTSGGRPRKPNHVSAGYTQAVSTGGGGAPPEIWACYSNGSWKETVIAAATPQDIERVERTWETADFWDGAYGLDVVSLPAPDIVIQGEEGRVGDWQPTKMGYGVRGPAFYLASSATEGVKSRRKGWYLHPWDIPEDHFSVDPPAWPEGQAYLEKAVDKYNREVGAQAFEIVNRGDLWTKVVLGGVYTLSLSLQGSHPTGLYGKVRVVAFIPDEDSGTMQVLGEWLGDPDEPADDHPPLDDPVEDVVLRAREYLGTRYLLGAEGQPGTSVDCSGLVFRVFTDTDHGALIGSARRSSAGYTAHFAAQGRFYKRRSVAERGDLIVYEHHLSVTHKVVHIALYLGNDKCISALVNPHGVSRHSIDGLNVDFHGVLKPAYPAATTVSALADTTTAVEADPEETTVDATVILDPGDDDFVIDSDPWA